jgi:hypothetical protein
MSAWQMVRFSFAGAKVSIFLVTHKFYAYFFLFFSISFVSSGIIATFAVLKTAIIKQKNIYNGKNERHGSR